MNKSRTRLRQTLMSTSAAIIITAPLLIVPLLKTHGYAQTAPSLPVASQQISFASVVAADKPAVVTVMTQHRMSAMNGDRFGQPFQDEPFGDFLRRFFGENGVPFQFRQGPNGPDGGMVQRALGSGFLIDSEGTIVTNNHVIDGADDIKVLLDDGTELSAKLIGADDKSDIAVIRVEAGKSLPYLEWGDSDAIHLGDPVLAIGNPFGIGTTVTSGIVSARGRDLHNGPYDDFIQVDASINRGNSGGPLVDSSGNVIGINTAIYSPNGGSVGVGFAIPSDQARDIVARLQKNGSIAHGYLGIHIQPVTAAVAEAIGLGKASGALVADVEANGPAERSGLQSGDVILTLGGKDVASPHDLARMVADLAPGSVQKAKIWREGKEETLKLTLGRSGQDNPSVASRFGPSTGRSEGSVDLGKLGVTVADLTTDARNYYQVDPNEEGAIVENIDPSGPAAESGLEDGDVILSVNQTHVSSAKQVGAAVDETARAGRKAVMFEVDRRGERTFIAVPFQNA